MEKRFDDVSNEVYVRIFWADLDTIEGWIEPALHSSDIASVFGSKSEFGPHKDRRRASFSPLDEERVIVIENSPIFKALGQLTPHRRERIMAMFTQPYYDQGRVDGKTEGRLQGKADGAARMLGVLLKKRFGDVPSSVLERISTADVETSVRWVERVIEEPDLESLAL